MDAKAFVSNTIGVLPFNWGLSREAIFYFTGACPACPVGPLDRTGVK
jgi:hypothetical protein